MIINEEVKKLVSQIEKSDYSKINYFIKKLITELNNNCKLQKVKERYAAYNQLNNCKLSKYPIENGYAQSFDPLVDENGFFDAWNKYGIVVGKSVISKTLCTRAVKRIHEMVYSLSNGKFDLLRPETYSNMPIDKTGVPIISRGFFEIYHDDLLAQIRQAIKIYIHHVVLWGRTDLWSSFDRLGVKLPNHEESYALPLHVDQNPKIHPNFKTIQGVLALTDCYIEKGTFVGVPGSKSYFSEYLRMADEKGEYVELNPSDEISLILNKNAQAIPIKEGDLISWDSRTTHSNTENKSKEIRYVVYIAAGPAREEDQNLLNAREDSFKTGLGSNVREALMHASKKPRYTNPKELEKIRVKEDLNLLGQLLYGKEKYENLK